MQPQYTKLLASLAAKAKAIESAATAGAEYYANGGGAARPGVAKHYTAGNQERYGWAPLSAAYAREKARGIVETSRGAGLYFGAEARAKLAAIEAAETRYVAEHTDKGLRGTVGQHHRKAIRAEARAKFRPQRDAIIAEYSKGRVGAKLDTKQTHLPQFDRALGLVERGTNLPMLVRTGRLRDAVTTVRHSIRRDGDVAYITFAGLPEYALYHQTGTAKLPRRSPVDPGPEDEAEIRAAIQRHLDAAFGTGRAGVPQSHDSIPGTAREAS